MLQQLILIKILKKYLEQILEKIKDYLQNFSDYKLISWDNLITASDQDLWVQVIRLIRRWGDEIMKDVFKLRVRGV